MLKASTLLVPEQLIYDDEIYHTHRVLLEGVETTAEALAVDVIRAVGPRGHFLGQKHTRRHLRDIWIPALTHPRPSAPGQSQPDIQRRAKAELDRILAEHEPAPLARAAQDELRAILEAAQQDLGA
jgi:trimethylamine--corrinoid protein Co-methyltransferase